MLIVCHRFSIDLIPRLSECQPLTERAIGHDVDEAVVSREPAASLLG